MEIEAEARRKLPLDARKSCREKHAVDSTAKQTGATTHLSKSFLMSCGKKRRDFGAPFCPHSQLSSFRLPLVT